MAIDGPGLFENDAAHDFVERVDEAGVAEVRRALREVLDHPDDYLDVDVVAEAWVAAELIAARAGEARQRSGDEPAGYDSAIAALTVAAELLGDALRVLDRLEDVEDNELAGFVEDMGEQAAWRRELEGLRVRLGRAHARHSTAGT